MKQKTRMGLYSGLIAITGTMMFLHVFNIYPLRTDKFSFFLVSLFYVLLVLPVITKVNIPYMVNISPRRKVLEVKAKKKK